MRPMLASLTALALLALAAAQDKEPHSLFDGKTLNGWTNVGGSQGNWLVKEGILVTRGEGGGWISTEQEYSDFELSLEYKLQAGGNSGVFIRSPQTGDPAYTGMEIQILDDDDSRYAELKPYQYCGSVYGVIAAKRGSTKGPGEWNTLTVRAVGPKIKITLNGTTIVDGDLKEHPEAAADHPGILRDKGYIGIQSHSEPVEFRAISIKSL